MEDSRDARDGIEVVRADEASSVVDRADVPDGQVAGPDARADQADAGLSIVEIRKAVMAIVEPELRSNDLARIANALGGIAEAMGQVIVYGAQGDRAKAQNLMGTTARVVVTRINAMLQVVAIDGLSTDN